MRSPTNRQRAKMKLKRSEKVRLECRQEQNAHHPPAVSKDHKRVRCCNGGHHCRAAGRVLSPRLHDRAANIRAPSKACLASAVAICPLPFDVNPTMVILAKGTERLRRALWRRKTNSDDRWGSSSVHSYELNLREKAERTHEQEYRRPS